ncbi:hypothetical protein DFS34DRAFT_192420 [Phlyctochytrium arcticum]|nr:hypothetical protein DFS34DRAFT_192420 [Phlyctochytrium arcticum]
MSSFNPSQLQGQQVYNIKSSAPQPNLSYNVMKFQSQKFSLDSLVPPVHMVRDLPKARRPHDAAEDASAETEEGANGKEKEKMDPTKVAPFGNAVKNRQNLFKKKTRSYVFAREPDADDSAPRKPRRDPDRFPWILSDFDSTTQYTGNVEAIAESTYMMLAVKDDTLELIPVSKWYKFMHKPKYRTLTLEEADEMLKLQGKRRLDTWVMHKKEKEESVEEKLNSSPTSVGGTSAPVKEEKSRLKKLLAGDDEPLRRQPRASRPRDDDAAELDFEEQKSDDEDLLFGIEDEEEAKEAIKRQYGKHGKRSGFIDDDDDDDEEDDDMGESGKGIAAAGKDLRKALKKADQVDDVYHSDEANPYLSEDDESEDEEQKVEDVKKEPSAEDTPINSSSTAAAIGASKLKRRKDGDPLSGPGKKLKREGSASPMTSPEHSTMMGKRKATMTKSPLHPGTATGGPARNLGSPALPAGSTSPPYSSSPNTAGRSAMGTKRKGAASSDDEKLEKHEQISHHIRRHLQDHLRCDRRLLWDDLKLQVLETLHNPSLLMPESVLPLHRH